MLENLQEKFEDGNLEEGKNYWIQVNNEEPFMAVFHKVERKLWDNDPGFWYFEDNSVKYTQAYDKDLKVLAPVLTYKETVKVLSNGIL